MSPIVTDGDVLQFQPQFGHRTVLLNDPAPRIAASGRATVGGKPVCILGDEKKVSLPATYTTPSHTVPGSGLVTIQQLAADQVATRCLNGQPLITRGSAFVAEFTPNSPATVPGTGVPDATAPSQGSGAFLAQQAASTAGGA